ncbi:three-Cys-motif partner protein TcmP [Cytophaga hutchinsonii]|uniref:GMT-like wHTH domain-containing protein n=1 Tax=Cytophaga hutchinsonii (strain ATCC 33406 / DSM 1761 / CIP 103989 / NBRC 15051 / NCIMB 9469 / D465) TaxID=269798 RepID=A0A6N4SWV1_CYTH3|nr:three-Cys-motif partner protein TcmP [Cytophaga hutchinsonii]ABG60912.1 conserved hypothetical protein [Cytophaga hutchinsonii ATCC 33406]SFX42351.1 three-Cys-motif partner protein [Cytophaga hutchinsonii ATCC 33406]
MPRDIHVKPFDEGTKAKLSIFQDYLREWLPVFISKRDIYWNNINIYDFFAGPGRDVAGVKGTPCIIIDELEPHLESIRNKNLKVNLYFNEYDKAKYELLNDHVLPKGNEQRDYYVQTESLDFKVAFQKRLAELTTNNSANLLFLDQNGIKHIGEETFKQIINIKRTDFLFFISSSTIKRFCEHPNILQHINLSSEDVEKTPYDQIHRLVLDYYKNLIPANKAYYLAPFSLKKNAGVYGLIFGSSHVLGMEKFLTTCWKVDPERGEANFDIDNDKINPGQINIFSGEISKPKKVEIFEKELEENITKGKIKTDKDVYLFTITNGFLPSHAKNVLKKLASSNKISKMKFNISSTICKIGASLTPIKLN